LQRVDRGKVMLSSWKNFRWRWSHKYKLCK
jgi:hypothetical protein